MGVRITGGRFRCWGVGKWFRSCRFIWYLMMNLESNMFASRNRWGMLNMIELVVVIFSLKMSIWNWWGKKRRKRMRLNWSYIRQSRFIIFVLLLWRLSRSKIHWTYFLWPSWYSTWVGLVMMIWIDGPNSFSCWKVVVNYQSMIETVWIFRNPVDVIPSLMPCYFLCIFSD